MICTDPTCTPVKHDRSDHLEPEGTALGRYWDRLDRITSYLMLGQSLRDAVASVALDNDPSMGTHFEGDECPGGHR